MKRFGLAAAAVLLASIGTIGATPSSAVTTTVCDHTFSFTTINGNVVVPNDDTGGTDSKKCLLDNVDVNGSVTVQTGGDLEIRGAPLGTHITGSVNAFRAERVSIHNGPSEPLNTIGGRLLINGNTTVDAVNNVICGVKINGLVTVRKLETGAEIDGDPSESNCDPAAINKNGPVIIGRGVTYSANNAGGEIELSHANVHGTVTVSHNNDRSTKIEGNTISGSLLCGSNTTGLPTNDGQANSVAGHETGQCKGL